MTTGTLSRSERIARLNDRARQAMGLACVAVATEGFRGLPEADQSRVRELVETFDAFTPDNDPYGERDFAGDLQEQRWPLDHQLPDAGQGCRKGVLEDRRLRPRFAVRQRRPGHAVTRRVLTIMLASEY